MCLSCEKYYITDDFRPQNGSISTKAVMDDYNVSFKEANILANKLDSDNRAYSINAYTKDEDTLFYVINYHSGWKVISGDKRTQAILAEDNSGSLDLRTIDNPGVKIWFEDLSDHLRAIKNTTVNDYNEKNLLFWSKVTGNYDKAIVQTRYFDPTDTSEIGSGYRWVRFYRGTTTADSYINTIPHMLSTKWGQSAPWNNGYPFNPNNPTQVAPTGCTAVAMAQVIYHSHYRLGKPAWLRHGSTVSGYIIDSNNYSYTYIGGALVNNSTRWDDMPLDSTFTNIEYVSSLMADVGCAVNMTYGLSGSGGWASSSAFNQFDIQCNHSSYSVSSVENSLSLGSPVVITAFRDPIYLLGFIIDYLGGHTWVIDGRTTRKHDISSTYEWVLISQLPYFPTFNEPDCQYFTEEEAMAYDPDLYSGKIEVINTSSYSNYWLMNWGYDGRYDSSYFSSYGDWTIGTHTYKYEKEIWYDFE